MSISKIKEIKEEIKKRKWFIDDVEKHIDKIEELKNNALEALEELQNYLDYDIEVVDEIDSLTNSQSESSSIRMSMDNLYNDDLDNLEGDLREEAVSYKGIITDLEVEIEELEKEIKEEKTKTKKKDISR